MYRELYCLSVYVLVHLSSLWKLVCMSVYISVCLSVGLYICVCLCQSICLPVSLSAYLSMCMCLCVCLLNCVSVCLYVYLYMCICLYTVNGEIFTGLNFRAGIPRKFFHEYKCLSVIVLNNQHLWPRECESISLKTSMALKLQIFSPANLSPSKLCV